MNHIINPAKPKTKGPVSGVIGKRRYSNYYDPTLVGAQIGANVAAQQASQGLGQDTSGSGSFNFGLIKDWINGLGNIAVGIWGSSGNVEADMLNEQLRQERRTTTILWVIIGLVLALGVVLVIRKTK